MNTDMADDYTKTFEQEALEYRSKTGYDPAMSARKLDRTATGWHHVELVGVLLIGAGLALITVVGDALKTVMLFVILSGVIIYFIGWFGAWSIGKSRSAFRLRRWYDAWRWAGLCLYLALIGAINAEWFAAVLLTGAAALIMALFSVLKLNKP